MFVCSSVKHPMEFLQKYYPIFLALVSFFISVYLWFNGQKEEGMYVGIWVPSILALGIFIHITNNKKDEND